MPAASRRGDYRFEGSMTARDVVGKLARGEVDELTLTFREGLTIKEMAPIYEAQRALFGAGGFRGRARCLAGPSR